MGDSKGIRYNIDAFHRLIGQELLKTCLTKYETEELNQFCEAADISIARMNRKGLVEFTKRIRYGKRKSIVAIITFSEDGFIYFGDRSNNKLTPEIARQILEHTVRAISVFLKYGLLEVD